MLSGSASDSLTNLIPLLRPFAVFPGKCVCARINPIANCVCKIQSNGIFFCKNNNLVLFRAFCPIKWMAGMNPNIFQLSRGWVRQRTLQTSPSRHSVKHKIDVSDFSLDAVCFSHDGKYDWHACGLHRQTSHHAVPTTRRIDVRTDFTSNLKKKCFF